MKKSIVIFLAVFLIACVSPTPQVTATSEATVTLTPIPAPTLHPQFIALQESIAASGGRFTLQADGLIYDGETPIPGVTVAPDGTMTLTVDGETVTLDPVDVDFDDEKGISINGYKWDATASDGAGAWVEANETVTANFDLGVVLAPGEANEDGSRNIETFAPPEEFADNEGAVAKWLKYFDAERLGFDPGATEWILTADGRAVMVDSADHSKIIAEWKHIELTDKDGIVFNAKNMVEADGENPLLDACLNWKTKWKKGIPVDLPGVVEFAESLVNNEYAKVFNGVDIMYGGNGEVRVSAQKGAFFTRDGMYLVYYYQLRNPGVADEGFVVTRDVDGNSIIFYVENMIWESY